MATSRRVGRTSAGGSTGSLRHDVPAGVVLGAESVPDGLAGGLLAGINPVYGLYGYLFGTLFGAMATSSAFMAVQATGAMAVVVSDIDAAGHGRRAAHRRTPGLTGSRLRRRRRPVATRRAAATPSGQGPATGADP